MLIVKRKIETLKEKISDMNQKMKEVKSINKDRLLQNERNLLTLEKKIKRLTLEITNKQIERQDYEIDLPRAHLMQKFYEMDDIAENLKQEYLKLEANLELAQDRNIELKLHTDRKIEQILNKKSKIVRRQKLMVNKLLEYEYLKNELGINQEEISDDEDVMDEPFYASKKREKKMKKEIVTLNQQNIKHLRDLKEKDRRLIELNKELKEINQQMMVSSHFYQFLKFLFFSQIS